MAAHPDFQLTTARCKFEEYCLEALAALPPVSNQSCVIRAPRFFHFNPQTNTQVQEYLPDSVNLKMYAISHLSGNPSELKYRLVGIGNNLGTWLRSFHTWAADPAQAKLQGHIKLNKEMQLLKNAINYVSLVSSVERYPDILTDAKDILEKVKKMSEDEMAKEDNLQIIHGDFWTGNALIPDRHLEDGYQPTIFIIDWELCTFGARPLDLAQMIAELYELYLYRGIQAGLWMIEGFCAGYGFEDDAFAFRTAIHVGTHLVCFGSVDGWGTAEQLLEVVAKGKEIIVRAWNKDREWFLASELSPLFGTSSGHA